VGIRAISLVKAFWSKKKKRAGRKESDRNIDRMKKTHSLKGSISSRSMPSGYSAGIEARGQLKASFLKRAVCWGLQSVRDALFRCAG